MKLGTKLIVSLVTFVLVTMAVHGYLSIRQDEENVTREIRVGMRGFSRAIKATLEALYADHQSLSRAQSFLDAVGPKNNIHSLLIYDTQANVISRSASMKDTSQFPELDPTPILKLDPWPALAGKSGTEGYVREGDLLIHYRIERIAGPNDETVGAFVLARHGSRLVQTIAERRDRIIRTTFVLVIVLSLLILIIVRRSVTRPINELITRVRDIAKGRWKQRIEIMGRDEVASLAREFNLMSEELEQSRSRLLQEQAANFKLEQDLRRSERLASVGRLAAGLAHEIGTPLNIISGRAEYLQRRPRSHEELQDNLQVIRSQSERITAIVRQLLEFARRREPSLRPVNLATLLKQVNHLLELQIREKRIHIEVDVPETLPTLRVDPELFQQVFLNLYSNSLHALGENGRITIRARFRWNGASSQPSTSGVSGLRILFEDNGSGILPEHLDRVFDPFFTTKEIGEGSGLGLSVVYGIIKDHGGEILAESETGKFTRFLIDLPMESDRTEHEREK